MKKFFSYLKCTAIIFLALFYSIQASSQKKVTIEEAEGLIQKNAAAIGLSSVDMMNTRITDTYYDQLSGATLIYLQQTINDIEVYNSIQTLAFKNDKLVSRAGAFNTQSGKDAEIPIASLPAEEAIKVAALHLQLRLPVAIVPLFKTGTGNEIAFGNLGIADNNVKTRLSWVPASNSKQLILAWLVEIQPARQQDYWIVKVDASNGEIIGKDNLTVYENGNAAPNHKRKLSIQNPQTHFTNEGVKNFKGINDITSASYLVVPFPAESPKHPGGTSALQTNPWALAPAGSNATTLQWNYDGNIYYDSARGNNVLVQEDHDGNNGFGQGAQSSTAQPALLFNYNPDFTKVPQDSLNLGFAITNLFYWSNIMHDISYLYGFDEVSGNFQENNLGRGGVGNDYLLADAQDGSGFNNANFSSPADGTKPRMQVFLFGGTPQIDADLDNGIICHEYAHGISRRLTGGPSNPGCLNNQEQMGEGWSDYFALMITTNWATAQTTDGSKKRPLANYANNQTLTGPGWRTYPYSIDMSIDPQTYSDLAGTGGEVHKIGEIWATALWEMTWEIIQQDGINPNLYDVNGVGGNSIALKLVMEGMKLQPCRPGFLDGRDAILKADTLLYSGRYSCAIWKAFAKRGMGLYAKQGSSDSYTDQVVDFSIYSFPYIVNHVNKISASEGDLITYTISVEAPHCQDISGYSVIDTLPANLTYINSSGIYNPVNKTVSITGIKLSQGQLQNFTISGLVKTGSYSLPVNYIQDSVINTSVSSAWETTSTTNTLWESSAVKSNSSPNAYFIKDSSGLTDASLQTSVSYTLTGKTTLSFWHYYDIEQGYDGGVLDISLDGGVTWQDLGPYIIQNGYSGSLIVNTPLIGGRQAFTGSSSGAFLFTKIDLSAFTGKTVQIRFLFVSDQSGGAEGWYIDDINLVSEASIFNSAQLLDNNNQLVVTGDTITTINNVALPITLLSFTGEVQEKQNLLYWTTSSEHNNRGFEIQRSINRMDFIKIDFINTNAINGNSNLNITYNVTDLNFPPGINYYRLKQIDKGGKFSFSNIVALRNNSTLSRLISIYPNPVQDILSVKITSGVAGKMAILIFDITGRQLMHEIIAEVNGDIIFPIDVSRLAKGTYSLKAVFTNGHQTQIVKFEKK